MCANARGQKLRIQLETALHRLVESFWEEPYRYFTESDAVTALWHWVARRPGLAQAHRTADGFETGLLHREYPTFFRLKDSNPTQRLGSPASRGHYDLALINPAYIQQHDAETVHNRDITRQGDRSSSPLVAAVEFKLFTQTWKPNKDTEVGQDLGKLKLALEPPADAIAAYMCVFCRDVETKPEDLEEYRQAVEELPAKYPNISFVLAVSWPKQRESFVHYSGLWITEQPDSI